MNNRACRVKVEDNHSRECSWQGDPMHGVVVHSAKFRNTVFIIGGGSGEAIEHIVALAELMGAGCFAPSSFALTIMPGALTVQIAAGSAFVGPVNADWDTAKALDAAKAMIAELEPFDRGRYAGPVGWLDASGDGEWVIALRGGQLTARDGSGGSITAYAGCGIVAESDPEAELAETELKFSPIRNAFA